MSRRLPVVTSVDTTRAAIQRRRIELVRQLRQAEAEVTRVQGLLQALEIECDHPRTFRTSHIGESCIHCRDCGLCGV